MNDSYGNDSGDCFDLQEAPSWTLGIYATLVAAIIVITVVGDGLVLLLVARYKQLRCRSVIVSLSVIAADILFALTVHLPVFLSTVMRRWPFTDPGCAAFSYLGSQFLITRWYIMGVLSIDRFCSVRFPFSYPKYSKFVLITLTAVAWVLPIVLGAASVNDYSFRSNIATCLPDCSVSDRRTICKLHYTVYLSLAFILGGILPIVLYIWLYWRARKLRPASVTLGKLSVQVASGAVVHQPIANLSEVSRDFRALVTVILIFVTLLVTGLPAYVLQIIRAVGTMSAICNVPTIILYLLYSLLLSSTALDPIVIMRDRDFRLCIKDLFHYHRVNDIPVLYSPSADVKATMNGRPDIPSGDLVAAETIETEMLQISLEISVTLHEGGSSTEL